MQAQRQGPWVVLVNHHGGERAMFLVSELAAMEDRGNHTLVYLKSGDRLKLCAEFDDVFDAVSIGVAVKLKLTAGTPTEQP